MTDTEILDWVIDNLNIVGYGIVSTTGCGCCASEYKASAQEPREALIELITKTKENPKLQWSQL